MRIAVLLLLFSVFLVLQFYRTNGSSFFSIIDDAREAMMKFSTGTVKKTDKETSWTIVSTSRTRKSRRTGWRSTARRRRRTDRIYVASGARPFSSKSARLSPTLTSKTETVTRSKPSNNFYEVLGKIERSILEAQASGNRKSSLTRLTRNMKLALSKKSYIFARKALGQALYVALTSRRKFGKRSTSTPGAKYLEKLKKELGEKSFNKLIGFDDDKTLIYVIDDTGSMSDDISAVKDISIDLVKRLKSKSGIDYILSVFNDPTVGPTKWFKDGSKMVTELKSLRAHGGGDYPELAFKGMERALNEGPQEGSPMFVFTDATAKAKDVAKYKRFVIDFAKDYGININFLIKGSASTFPPFVEAATETCGMILRLADAKEIKKLKSIVRLSLSNYACISNTNNNSGRFGKRSTTKSHEIKVDDSLDKMIISVATQSPNPVVTLRNPKGVVEKDGKISLLNVVIYELQKPIPGRWTLTVSARSGKYHYLVRGNGAKNIDFDYYFVMVPRRGKKVPIPISQPLSGQQAIAIVTVTGAEKIQTSKLKLDVIDGKRGTLLKTLTLRPRTRSKEHFLISFIPPSTPFRFRMRGTTLAGNKFERSSRKTIKPLSAVVRVYKAMNGVLALPRGRRMYVIMKIFNSGPTEVFDITINDPLKYVTSRRRLPRKVYRKRDRRFAVFLKASSSAKPGTGFPIAVTIRGRRSGVVAGQVLNMIVT